MKQILAICKNEKNEISHIEISQIPRSYLEDVQKETIPNMKNGEEYVIGFGQNIVEVDYVKHHPMPYIRSHKNKIETDNLKKLRISILCSKKLS